MKAAVVVFPGSNCDSDCHYALKESGFKPSYVWHKETELPKVDLIVLPGGFSYGDYLRTGALAQFSPIMKSVKDFADKGGSVIGICNGFQVLLETGLLPGAMLRNRDLQFICKHVYLKVANNQTRFTSEYEAGQILSIPIAHGEGNYFADEETLKVLDGEGRIAFQYVNESGEMNDSTNPNGSQMNIAGIFNKEKNILGMMPHPERAMEDLLGSEDGQGVWNSIIKSAVTA